MQNNNTLNGVELCLPNYFDHNKTGTIGIYEKLEADPKGIKNNFFRIVHYFKYAPTTETYRENDLSNQYADPNSFRQQTVPNPTGQLVFTDLPFFYLDRAGKVQWDTKKNYVMPNEYNPYAGKVEAARLYAGVHSGELPILTEFEAQRIKNKDVRPVDSFDPRFFDPSVTNCKATIMRFREHPEYGNGLREFIMVSLGELEYKDENGVTKKLEANQNTQIIEVSVQRNAIPLEDWATDEQWDASLEISRIDIDRIDKMVGGAGATPEGLKAMQLIKSMSKEEKENLDLLTSMSAQEKADFEAFKLAKKNEEALQAETEAKNKAKEAIKPESKK